MARRVPDFPLPNVEAPSEAILECAMTYNGYERWGEDPEYLQLLLSPVTREWDAAGVIPSWAGLDTLRALLFLEFRTDYFSGGSEEGIRRMREVVAAIHAWYDAVNADD